MNAIGVAANVDVELAHIRLRKNDKLLLCSDGLHDYFPAHREVGELMQGANAQAAVETLVGLAKERGGHDNITGIVVDVVEGQVPDRQHSDTVAIQALPDDKLFP